MLFHDILPSLRFTPDSRKKGVFLIDGDKKAIWEFLRNFVPDQAKFVGLSSKLFGMPVEVSFTVKKDYFSFLEQRKFGVSELSPYVWPKTIIPSRKDLYLLSVDRNKESIVLLDSSRKICPIDPKNEDALRSFLLDHHGTLLFPDFDSNECKIRLSQHIIPLRKMYSSLISPCV